MELSEKSDITFGNVKNQLYATVIANWIVLSYGCIVGWLSPALPILLSTDSPLVTGPITSEELSWISSMSSGGAVVGTFIFGVLSAVMGSKRSMTLMAFPVIAYWLLVHFGDSFYHIIAARFITGWTVGGIQSGVALYVAEISNDNIRGRLGPLTPLARSTGILIGYIGTFVEYQYRSYIFIFFPIMYVFWIYALPNTPLYYLNRGNHSKAESALMYYKGCTGIDERERSFLKAEYERLQLIVDEQKRSKRLQFSDFLNRKALKGILISIAMAWFLQTTGSFLITNYASLIFSKTGTLFDPNMSSIILAIVQIVAGLTSSQLGDAFGRKIILITSLFGSAMGLFTLAAYSYLRENDYDVTNFNSLPLLMLCFIIFISNAGIIALGHICAIENYPSKIRTAGVILYSLCVSTVAFAADKYFPIALESIRLHGCLLFFAISCCCGVVFVTFMNETNGQSLNQISISAQDCKLASPTKTRIEDTI